MCPALYVITKVRPVCVSTCAQSCWQYMLDSDTPNFEFPVELGKLYLPNFMIKYQSDIATHDAPQNREQIVSDHCSFV